MTIDVAPDGAAHSSVFGSLRDQRAGGGGSDTLGGFLPLSSG